MTTDHLIAGGAGNQWQSEIDGRKGNFATRDGFRAKQDGPLSGLSCGVYFIRVMPASSQGNTYDYIGLSAAYSAQPYQRGIPGRLGDHMRKLCCLPHRTEFGTSIATAQGISLDEAPEWLSRQKFASYAEFRNAFRLNQPNKNRFAFTIEENFMRCFVENERHLQSYDDIVRFFKDRVLVSFNQIDSPPEHARESTIRSFIAKIAKIEGLAMQAYAMRYKNLPNLNSVDETRGVNGFLQIF
jgi:hypothetical protein